MLRKTLPALSLSLLLIACGTESTESVQQVTEALTGSSIQLNLTSQ